MLSGKPRFLPAQLKKDDVKRVYARLSRFYDGWGILTESKAVGRAIQLAHIRDGENVLEVAVGTGRVFEGIVSANGGGRNIGIDLSLEMLSIARRRLGGKSSNCLLEVADAYQLPFLDGSYDLLVNNYMFDLLPEQDFGRVLCEFRRVLKSRGRMVITTMTSGRRWYSRIWDLLIRKSPNLLAGCRPISLARDIEQADFTNLHEEYVSQFTFPSLIVYAVKP